jgi:hypothetical protein
MKTNIDYYGDKDSYIHLKFGEARKCYFFTNEFVKKYPEFCKSYENYFFGESNENPDNEFYSAYDIVETAQALGIPANFFYFNFTDTPAKSYKEIKSYLDNEN